MVFNFWPLQSFVKMVVNERLLGNSTPILILLSLKNSEKSNLLLCYYNPLLSITLNSTWTKSCQGSLQCIEKYTQKKLSIYKSRKVGVSPSITTIHQVVFQTLWFKGRWKIFGHVSTHVLNQRIKNGSVHICLIKTLRASYLQRIE